MRIYLSEILLLGVVIFTGGCCSAHKSYRDAPQQTAIRAHAIHGNSLPSLQEMANYCVRCGEESLANGDLARAYSSFQIALKDDPLNERALFYLDLLEPAVKKYMKQRWPEPRIWYPTSPPRRAGGPTGGPPVWA